LITRIKGTDLYLSSIRRGETSDIKLSAYLNNGEISVAGKLALSPTHKPILDSEAELKIIAKRIEVGHFWPYYSKYVPFEKVTGELNVNSDFKGKINKFSSTGEIGFKGLYFNYQPIFNGPLSPKMVEAKYVMERNPGNILVKSLDFAIDGFSVKGSCLLRDLDKRDPTITAKAVTAPFDYNNIYQYIPYGIIPETTSNWIAEHVKGGTYKLDEGHLDGKVSQILHMEKGDN
ncbi:MAG: DUF748 domain-containing protein, partial [Desulfuromonadales bacterium]|nr:DUF748 domain-containing protein [Desulfuromonadales bacterium]